MATQSVSEVRGVSGFFDRRSAQCPIRERATVARIRNLLELREAIERQEFTPGAAPAEDPRAYRVSGIARRLEKLASGEKGQLPLGKMGIVTQNIDSAIEGSHLEVTVIRGQPLIEYLFDLEL